AKNPVATEGSIGVRSELDAASIGTRSELDWRERERGRPIGPSRERRQEQMTRENKAGLAVSGSFLILVGVVLTMKLREHPAAPGPDLGGALAQATAPPLPRLNGPAPGRPPGGPGRASQRGPGREGKKQPAAREAPPAPPPVKPEPPPGNSVPLPPASSTPPPEGETGGNEGKPAPPKTGDGVIPVGNVEPSGPPPPPDDLGGRPSSPKPESEGKQPESEGLPPIVEAFGPTDEEFA